MQIGIGTKVADVVQQFSQGNVSTTNNPLDLAINGNGFFRMSQNGAISYTRNGQFQLDKNGFIVNGNGLKLTGFPATSAGIIDGGSTTELQIPSQDLAPKATGKLGEVLNLDARAKEPLTTLFDPKDPTSYNFSTSVNIYDSLGNAHVFTDYFVKTATPNKWKLHATADGTSTTNVDLGAGAGNPVDLDFDTNGKLTTTMPFNVSVDLDGVALELGTTNGATTPLKFKLDFTNTTQFGSGFGVNSLSQDGYTSGRPSGFNIAADGIILGRYTNGQSLVLGQVALTNFRNPNGLISLGDNLWAVTSESGEPLVGAPGSGSLGALQSAAVENSNVDLTQELVNMITAQRVYQANAQSIKTQDSVLQTLVNLR